ncbi:MAG: iron uptake protein [Rhizobacter sp.]
MAAPARTAANTPWRLALRIALALLGGYAFAWGFIASGMAALYAAGMSFHDAQGLASLLGFLVFLSAFLWAFAARSLVRVGVVLLGGGALLSGAASWLQSTLVA